MHDDVRAALEKAALDYLAARPWRVLRDEHFFGVTDAETSLEGWASVAGNAGEEFGLGLYIGADGRRLLEKTLALDIDVERQNQASDVVALTVAEEAEATQFRAGTRLERSTVVEGKTVFPIVFRKPPGESARTLKDREGCFLARALTAIVKTREWGLTEEDVVDEVGGRLVMELSGPLEKLQVDRRYDVPMHAGGKTVPADLATKLHEAPRVKRLLAGFQEGTLTLYDPRERKRLHSERLEQDHPAVGAQRLVELLAGQGPLPAQLPREIWTDAPSLESAARDLLEPFGVKIVAKLELKELRPKR
jgi:hypothetical protein